MKENELTLHVDARFASPYAMSVFVALREKGLPFALKTVDLRAREHLAPGFAAASLSARVPMLEHGGFALSESSAISEYLDEAFPPPGRPPLYPRDLRDRARARQVQAWLRSDLMPIREERPTDVIFFGPSDRPLSDAARAAAARLFEAAGQLLAGGRANLFGDWCIADTDLALMIRRLVANGDEVPAALAGWSNLQWERASVQEWVALGRQGR